MASTFDKSTREVLSISRRHLLTGAGALAQAGGGPPDPQRGTDRGGGSLGGRHQAQLVAGVDDKQPVPGGE